MQCSDYIAYNVFFFVLFCFMYKYHVLAHIYFEPRQQMSIFIYNQHVVSSFFFVLHVKRAIVFSAKLKCMSRVDSALTYIFNLLLLLVFNFAVCSLGR